jgi:hypothetical protein
MFPLLAQGWIRDPGQANETQSWISFGMLLKRQSLSTEVAKPEEVSLNHQNQVCLKTQPDKRKASWQGA